METVQAALWVVILLVALALIFDFMNGFHDAANSIATVVSTGVLKPGQAVVFAAFFNFIAIFVFHLSVAATVGKGIADPSVVDPHVVFGALTGAITWNLITWYYGIPSSSSHALIGGIVGAVIAKAGTGALVATGILRTVAFIFVSPFLGFLLGSLMMVIVAWIFRRTRPLRVDGWFRRLQLVSAGAYSLGHGGNDAQKTIGIIWMLLIATGYAAKGDASPPTWTIVSCYAAIGLGTMFGGWRIVKTMGQKITKLKPVGGFCAETGGAMTLFLATMLGVPVSTTHTITGAIVGVGSVQRASAVRWGVAGNIVWAWVLTIPAAATAPVEFDRTAYLRIGSATPRLSDHPERLRSLWAKLQPYAWETGIAAQFLTGDDVLERLNYANYFDLTGQPLPDNRQGIFDRLLADRLIQKDVSDRWNITNLGAILYAKKLADFGPSVERKGVRFVAYAGTGRADDVSHRQDGQRGVGETVLHQQGRAHGLGRVQHHRHAPVRAPGHEPPRPLPVRLHRAPGQRVRGFPAVKAFAVVERHIGVVSVTDTQVLRAERF